jgi:hypothetical protein
MPDAGEDDRKAIVVDCSTLQRACAAAIGR